MQVPLGDTLYFKFTTRSFSTGAPTQLAGTPVVDVYEENNLTQITAAETLTVDYDSVTGLNDVAVVCTGANGFEVGKYYQCVITTGTVGGVSVVGECVGPLFRIMPAEDAGAGIPDVNVTHMGDTAGTFSAGRPEVNTTHAAGTAWGSGAITAGAIATDAITAAKIAANAIGASELAADAVTEIQSGLATAASIAALNDLSAAQVNAEVDTALADIHLDHLLAVDYDPAAKPGTATALLNEIVENNGGVSRFTAAALAQAPDTTTGLSLAADQSGVTIGTANALAAGSITAGVIATDAIDADALAADAVAEINATVDTALTDIGLDHLLAASVTGTDVTDNSIIARMVSSAATADWDTFVNTDDSLQAISESGGGGPTAAQIADAVWDELQADHTTVGTFGVTASEIADILADTNELQTDDVPGLIAALNNISTAQVNAEVDTALADIGLDHLVAASVVGTDVADNSIIAKMVASGATADWDTFVNTTESLQALRDQGDAAWATATGFSTHSAADVWSAATRTLTANTNLNDPTAAAIADAVWDETLADHLTAGSTGNALNAAGSAGDPWATALPGAYGAGTAGKIIGDNINAPLDTIDANVDLILDDTGTSGVALAAATQQSIADTLLTRQMTESYAANGTAPTLAQAQFAIHQMLMQFGISGTSITVRKLDDTTTAFVVTLDDATAPTDASRV